MRTSPSAPAEREPDLISAVSCRVHQSVDDVDDFLDIAVVGRQVFFQFFYSVSESFVCPSIARKRERLRSSKTLL
jgi:hypothetical protein